MNHLLTRPEWKLAIRPATRLNIWEWAARNVDFSRCQSYDTPRHEPFDPEWMPYWKEPVECLTDASIREVSVLKCSRAGGSENILLNPIRFAIAQNPQPTLYVTGDQLSAERFMEKRVKRGLRSALDCWRAFKAAQATQHDIAFPGMDFRVTWPKARQAFKQDGWATVLCDEVSLWPEYSADMARKRTDSYPFPHIVFISSPDPASRRSSDDDPIFVEYRRGDQRKWNCADPKTGKPFVFAMGERDGPGLVWDKAARKDDGTWDLDRVRATAHYVTPDGSKIENRDRMTVVRSGKWVATAPNAPANTRSYHINAFMVPFKSGDFGEIAVAFLQAQARGPQNLRTFIYEYLAEPWTQDVEKIYDDQVTRRAAEYRRGQSYFELHTELSKLRRGKLMTVDVQKLGMWYIVREWAVGGQSCLIEWGYVGTWTEIDAIATTHKVEAVMVDAGYGERTTEVYEECLRRRMVPAKGDDRGTAPDLPWRSTDINPYEGTRRQVSGESLKLVLWHTDTFKLMLLGYIRGDRAGWFVYRGVERDYCMQISAEERTPKGWVKRRRDNHILDCEAMQIVAALAYGYLSKFEVPDASSVEAGADQKHTF